MQTALITGANTGIGLITAKALAAKGFQLIIVVRSEQKAAETKATILKETPTAIVDAYIADLELIDTVKAIIPVIKAKYTVIDRFINNAGYSPDIIEYTEDGFERSFIANHLGPFVLTNGLIDLVEASPEGRIISVSSMAHSYGKFNRMFLAFNKDLNAMKTYSDGKLANILFTRGLVKHLRHATAYCLHPGVVKTGFGSLFTGGLKVVMAFMKPFMISPEQGAATTIYLATTELKNIKNHNGGYFDKSKPKATLNADISDLNVDKLWAKSLEVATFVG